MYCLGVNDTQESKDFINQIKSKSQKYFDKMNDKLNPNII